MKKAPFYVNKIVIALAIFVVVVFGGIILWAKLSANTTASTDQQQSIAAPKETKEINKDFEFPIKDSDGNTVTTISYAIQSAQIQDQIIVKGQKATAVTGRTFLIINLKLSNKSNKLIQINTRDYVRLGVNGDDKDLLAPDIHNDPVQVQPIATEYTKLGFPVNTSDKKFTLYIGEIDGSKSAVPLQF